MSTVNAEVQDQNACATASMAYLVSPPLATERHKDVTFQIVQILVVGVITKTARRARRANQVVFGPGGGRARSLAMVCVPGESPIRQYRVRCGRLVPPPTSRPLLKITGSDP